MPATVANLEDVLIRRVGGKLKAAGLDATARDGTNADLRGPIIDAIRGLGRATASAVAVVDADLAAIPDAQLPRLYDLASIQALYACLGNLSECDEKAGGDEQRLSQLVSQVNDAIKLYEGRLLKPYGPQVGGTAIGELTTARPMPNDPFALPCSRSRPRRWPY